VIFASTATADPIVLGAGGRAYVGTCSVTFVENELCSDPNNGASLFISEEDFSAGSNGERSAALEDSRFNGEAQLFANNLDLPILQAEALVTESNTWVSTEYFTLRSYVYMGETSTTRILKGELHLIQSGGHTVMGSVGGMTRSAVGVFEGPVSDDSLTEKGVPWELSGNRIARFDIGRECDGINPTFYLGAVCVDGQYEEFVGAGEFSETLSATFALEPGQEFAVFAYLSASGKGGGFANAADTMTTAFLDEAGNVDNSGIVPVAMKPNSTGALPIIIDLLLNEDSVVGE
jgi:hypothetical protein